MRRNNGQAIILGLVILALMSLGLRRTSGYFAELSIFLLFFFFFVFSFVVHILLHELGHLIFGLLTGYKFVSLRILSWTLVKKDQGLKLTRYCQPGAAGQCVMIPPRDEEGNFPFLLYNLGGGVLNLLVSLPIFIPVFIFDDIPSFKAMAMLLFSGAGLVLGLSNVLPFRTNGLPSDGLNLLNMVRYPRVRQSFYNQLVVQGLLNKGVRPRDLQLDQLILEEDHCYSKPCNTSIILLQHQQHLDRLDFEGASQALEVLQPFLEGLLPAFRQLASLEKIFIGLVQGDDNLNIEEVFDEKTQGHLKSCRHNLTSLRLLMAYEALYRKDYDRALAYYDAIEDLAKDYPIQGEAQMELMLASHVRAMFD